MSFTPDPVAGGLFLHGETADFTASAAGINESLDVIDIGIDGRAQKGKLRVRRLDEVLLQRVGNQKIADEGDNNADQQDQRDRNQQDPSADAGKSFMQFVLDQSDLLVHSFRNIHNSLILAQAGGREKPPDQNFESEINSAFYSKIRYLFRRMP